METQDVRKIFGSELRRRRKELGLSQEEFGERANLHRTYVSDVEAGKRNPSLQSMQRLASAVGTSIGSVFGAMEGILGEARGGPAEKFEKVVDILLVENDAKDAEVTIGAFKKAGLSNRVEVVRDGSEALDFLFGGGKYANRQPSNRPQLVLLNLQLPRTGGLEVLRRLKSDENTRSIPVIILTGSPKDDELQQALKLGADAYMPKPVDFENFSRITPKMSFNWALIKNGK
jgi:CheY-like chemotaxis protein/DNA-binding XRE family transcriptional regulator